MRRRDKRFLIGNKTGNKTDIYSRTKNKHPAHPGLVEFVLFMVFHSTFRHANLIKRP